MNISRNSALQRFLTANRWDDANFKALDGDASNRRYLRLERDNTSAILMDAPPESGEDVHSFAAMTHWLRSVGLSAPRLLGGDFQNGLLLLEDLGTDLYSHYLAARPGDDKELYTRAVDVLVHIARCPVPHGVGIKPYAATLPPYNMEVLEREALLLAEWWPPATTGKAAPSERRNEYLCLITDICKRPAENRDVVVLRDYHADNLIWLPARNGTAAVGLLDYQDAVAGHPAYDLVSLLEDARRDTSPELRAAMLDYYLAQRPELNGDAFRADYAALGAQRNLKIIGIFTRLATRDGKKGYLDLIPRVWQHLRNDLQHPDLAALRQWIDANIVAPESRVLNGIRARGCA